MISRERRRFGTTSPKVLGKASCLRNPMLLCISSPDARSQKVEVRRSKAMSKVANDYHELAFCFTTSLFLCLPFLIIKVFNHEQIADKRLIPSAHAISAYTTLFLGSSVVGCSVTKIDT